MATLLELYGLFFQVSETFRNRCIAAIAKWAYNILVEAPETPNHEQRLAWADRVLTVSNPIAEWDRMRFAVLSSPVILADPDAATDGDIEYVVNTICHVYA